MKPDKDVHYLLSTPLENGATICEVCPHRCTLRQGQVGRCRVRVNRDGRVQPIQSQGLVALGVATVEEHPLYHFYPGMRTLCVGSLGCTAACDFCQNWELALAPHHNLTWPSLMPADAGEVVRHAQVNGCGAISFTYNEGAVWPEFMSEVMELGRQHGLKNVLVTNGFVSDLTWAILLPWLDGMKIDLKGSNNEFYRCVVGIDLHAVLHSLDLIREHRIWHEISTVIIPGVNDSPEAIEPLVKIILKHSGPNTPWHLMRFFPAYRGLGQPPGDIDDLRRIRQIARGTGLANVYISNVPGVPESSSNCPACSQLLSVRGLGNRTPLPPECLNCGEPICGRGLV